MNTIYHFIQLNPVFAVLYVLITASALLHLYLRRKSSKKLSITIVDLESKEKAQSAYLRKHGTRFHDDPSKVKLQRIQEALAKAKKNLEKNKKYINFSYAMSATFVLIIPIIMFVSLLPSAGHYSLGDGMYMGAKLMIAVMFVIQFILPEYEFN